MSLFVNITLLMIFTTGFYSCVSESQEPKLDDATYIRIKNSTGLRIDSVHLAYWKHTYRSIELDGYSEYQKYDKAFKYDWIDLYSGASIYTYHPGDALGEINIGNGKFTYELELYPYDQVHLTLKFINDSTK